MIELEYFNDGDTQPPWLVRGVDDVYWCETLDEAIDTVRQEAERLKSELDEKSET